MQCLLLGELSRRLQKTEGSVHYEERKKDMKVRIIQWIGWIE